MSIIERVFWRDFSKAILIFLILAVILVVMICFLRGYRKRYYVIWGITTAVVMTIMGMHLMNIHLDIKEGNYITYEGVYEERGGGMSELKTVAVFDENGKEVRLLRTGNAKTGEYEGTVVYGKRSKIIVEYNGEPID